MMDEWEKANEDVIIYLNHWENWPELDDQRMNDYLTKGESQPNDNGNKVWAQYLSNYFIAN